jgi:hypothetical protein
MATMNPDFTPAHEFADTVRARGHAALAPSDLAALISTPKVDTPLAAMLVELQALSTAWDDLPADGYLRDSGRYRRRRHASLVVQGDTVTLMPHRAHWQPVSYNALHGGLERWFEPIKPALLQAPAWSRLLARLAALCSDVQGGHASPPPWYVEAHQFRIDTTGGIGRPTPEGAHRDGVDFVFVIVVARHLVKGGETRVFEADGPHGIRFTLTEPWTLLMLDDARVVHETTPIQPAAPGDAGYRDTLVLTFRRQGFQDPPA